MLTLTARPNASDLSENLVLLQVWIRMLFKKPDEVQRWKVAQNSSVVAKYCGITSPL